MTTGTARVKFYYKVLDSWVARSFNGGSPDNYLIAYGGSGNFRTNEPGNGTAKIPLSELSKLTGGYTEILQHDVAVVYLMGGVGGATEQKVATFTIASIKTDAGGYGQPSFMTISGPDMLHRLTKTRKYLNIGKRYEIATNDGLQEPFVPDGVCNPALDGNPPFIHVNFLSREDGSGTTVWQKYSWRKNVKWDKGDLVVALHEPTETAKAAGDRYVVGEDFYINWQFGTQQTQRTSIADIDYVPGSHYIITLSNPLEANVQVTDTSGTPQYYPCFRPDVWKGDPIEIQMDDGNWHTTRVAAEARYDSIILEEMPGCPRYFPRDSTVYYWNVREANTINDIEDILDGTGWTPSLTVSSNGSSHIVDPKGTDVLSLLASTAESNDDYFYSSQASASVPEESLAWKTSSPSSGITLVQASSGADALTKVVDSSYGIILNISEESRDLPIKSVVPVGGVNDDVNFLWNLGHCSETATAGLARVYGLTLAGLTTTYEGGVWKVTNPASPYESEEQLDFTDIEPKSVSPSSIIESANLLQARAALALYRRQAAEEAYRITCVLVPGAEINPGETIVVDYTDSTWDINSETFYIGEFSHKIEESGDLKGLRITDMVVSSDGPRGRVTGATAVANAIKKGLSGRGFGIGSGGLGTTNPNDGGVLPPGNEDVIVASSTPVGSLTAEGNALTFILSAGDGLVETGTAFDIDLATNSGLLTTVGKLSVGPGNGIEVVASEVSVDLATNSGLAFSSGDLAVGTPSQSGAQTSNAVSGASHTHSILGYTSAITNPLELLKTDSNGRLSVSGLGINTAATANNLRVNGTVVLVGAQSITTTADDMTLAPADDLILDPTGDNVLFPSSVDPQGQGWASGFLGSQWGLDTGLGHIDARSAYFDELRVTLFSADETLVLAGSHMVTPGMAKLSRDFDIPAVGVTDTLYLHDSEALPDTAVATEDSWLMIRAKDTTGVGLTVANVWGQISNYTDLSGGGDGEQTWDFVTRSLGASIGGNTIPAESVALGFGHSGQGWVLTTTNDLAGSPYMEINTWHGDNPYTAANRIKHLRLGNLNGIADHGVEYGLYVGMSETGPRLSITDSQASFYHLPMSWYYASSNDGGYFRIYALELNSDVSTAVAPDGDISQTEIVRSTGTGTWYSHINENPSSGQPDSQYIRNTAGKSGSIWFPLEDISHTLTTLSLEAYITTHDYSDDLCRMYAQVFKNDEVTELTDRVLIVTESSQANGTGQTFTVDFTGVDTTASDAEWAAAKLYIEIVYHTSTSGASEVIRIEPNMELGPYIAVGGTLPTGPDQGGDGVWAGRYSTNYRFRVGGTSSSGTPRMVFNGDTLELRNGNTNDPVIQFSSTGDSYFSGTMTIDTDGNIVSGETQFDATGINIGSYAYAGSPTNTQKVRFVSGATQVAYLASSYHSTSGYKTIKLQIEGEANDFINLDSFYGTAISSNGYMYLDAPNQGFQMASNKGISLQGGLYVGTSSPGAFSSDGCGAFTNSLIVGNSETVLGQQDQGTLVLDQAGLDGAILMLMSSDVSHDLGGLSSSPIYGQFLKANEFNGGLRAAGFSEQAVAVQLLGRATSANTVTTTSAYGTITLDAYVNDANPGSTDNVLVVRGGTTALAIVKGNGDLHLNGVVGSAFDTYDDVALVRAASLLSPHAIRSQFDDMVQYNRGDLEAAGLVSGTLVNTTGFMRLHSGAIWQLHQRIVQLENFISEKLGLSPNDGTIIENGSIVDVEWDDADEEDYE